ncbi:hypothetical protein ABZ464_18105 [Streptomyces sp. NPDC005820]|uniref:hypothetical protein n=1 Tax=Streptomyces sp. NPDC005820 TaxID=3157069 RepID=UPI0033E65455
MTVRTTVAGLRRKAAVVAGLAAMVAAGGVVAASPASAGPNCDSGNHCVFFTDINSSKHQYFNTDPDFGNDTFGNGVTVSNQVWSASNSTTGGYESHYYNYTGTDWDANGFLFCVNPGHYANSHFGDGGTDSRANGAPLPDYLRNKASSLRLRGTTSIDCY